jgi:glutamate-5-semialdehyde dehydrogenase
MTLDQQIDRIGADARVAARALAALSTETRNAILHAMAGGLIARTPRILEANAKDVLAATENGLNKAAIDRLRLSEERIAGMAEGIRQVANLEDPVGKVISEWARPNGLRIAKVRTPIGVIGIIYESRPNVTSDAAVLCLKTGNAVILRGGSEALNSNLAIAEAAPERASAHSDQGPKCRGPDGGDGPVHRPYHSPRWPFPDRDRRPTRANAGHQALSWRLPRLCG